MRKVVACVTTGLLLACAACNKNPSSPVSGRVTYRGYPASGAAVFFFRQGGDSINEPPIMGFVGEDGSFSLGKGAPVGQYAVVVEWKRGSGQSKGRRRGPDMLGRRYADPKNPRLYAEIKAGTNDLPPFQLTDY
jgi:hypothetical protein